MPTAAPRSRARPVVRALLLSVLLTVVWTWGPAFAAWCRPALLGSPACFRFSYQGRDFDVTDRSGWLGWVGSQRHEAIAMRGISALNPPAVRSRDIALAQQVIEADRRLLGPMQADAFSRPGLIFHRHRGGFPFTCVEASICLVWRESGLYEGLSGGARIPRTFPGTPNDGLVWLFPWGVRFWGLAANLAFWMLIVGTPPGIRVGISAARRRAGRCTACGYDRRGIPDGPCPECGAAV